MIDNKVLLLGGPDSAATVVQSLEDQGDISVVAISMNPSHDAVQSNVDDVSDHVFVDLIILDAPDSSGAEIDLCRQLRIYFAGPILLLTNNSSENYQVEAYNAGVDECIVKPISDDLLMAKVYRWLVHSHPH